MAGKAENLDLTNSDGKDYQVNYYSLDIIIFVNYRIKPLFDTFGLLIFSTYWYSTPQYK